METAQMKPIDILLVEDNPADVELTKEAFLESKINNNIHVASDGKEALEFLYQRGEFLKTKTPDLILLDLNLPGIDGRQVLSKIKDDKKLRRIPVIILSSSKSEEDVQHTYDLHTNAYVKKPIDYYQFVDIVEKIDSFWFGIATLPSEFN